MPLGLFPLLLLILLLLPLLFLDIMIVALGKLGISPEWAPLIVLGMLLGSLVNIPVMREPLKRPLPRNPMDIWGIQRYLPHLQRQVTERVIAINVGGFVIPMLLVVYEVIRLWRFYPQALGALVAAVLINVVICYSAARPVKNVGVMMPILLPGLAAALSALLLAPEVAPPVAFCAGVLGPVIGADLMNLGKIRREHVGMASIGGAGTFDGIVISGLLAVLLA